MKRLHLFAFAMMGLLAVSCSSKEKKIAEPSPSAAVSKSVTSEEITQKYSLKELSGAATLLRAVVDEAAVRPSDDKGTDLIGCSLTGNQAHKMTMPIKSLIDRVMYSEIEAYTADPKSYAADRSFETCAASCACGVFSDVVEAANESSLPPGSARNHTRNKQRLSLKASHQSARDTLVCARKQSWFCSSELKSYLEKDAASNAD